MPLRTTSAIAGGTALLNRGVRDQLRLCWRLLRDERVSALKFALPALLALYVLSPVDSIPDFLLGPGQIDDAGVLIAGVLLLARVMPWLAPRHVVDEHLRNIAMDRPSVNRDEKMDDVFEAEFNLRQ